MLILILRGVADVLLARRDNGRGLRRERALWPTLDKGRQQPRLLQGGAVGPLSKSMRLRLDPAARLKEPSAPIVQDMDSSEQKVSRTASSSRHPKCAVSCTAIDCA